jgi:hypothetical protein
MPQLPLICTRLPDQSQARNLRHQPEHRGLLYRAEEGSRGPGSNRFVRVPFDTILNKTEVK